MSENQQGNRKVYSFLEIVDAINSKGNPYKHITLSGTLTNIEQKYSPDGDLIVSGRMAINNRAKALNYALGTNFDETANDDTIWVNVEAWRKTGERLANFAGDRKTVRMTMVGSIKVNKYTDRNNVERTGLKVTIADFKGEYSNNSGDKANSTGNAGSGNHQNSAPAPQQPQQPPHNMYGNAAAGFSDFADLDDDGELPF